MADSSGVASDLVSVRSGPSNTGETLSGNIAIGTRPVGIWQRLNRSITQLCNMGDNQINPEVPDRALMVVSLAEFRASLLPGNEQLTAALENRIREAYDRRTQQISQTHTSITQRRLEHIEQNDDPRALLAITTSPTPVVGVGQPAYTTTQSRLMDVAEHYQERRDENLRDQIADIDPQDINAFINTVANYSDSEVHALLDRNNPNSENYGPLPLDYLILESLPDNIRNLPLNRFETFITRYLAGESTFRNSQDAIVLLGEIEQVITDYAERTRNENIENDRLTSRMDNQQYRNEQMSLIEEASRLGLNVEIFEYTNTGLRSLISLRLSEDPHDSFTREIKVLELATYGPGDPQYDALDRANPDILASEPQADMLRLRLGRLHSEFNLWNEMLDHAIEHPSDTDRKDLQILSLLDPHQRREYWISMRCQELARGYEMLETHLSSRASLRESGSIDPDTGRIRDLAQLEDMALNGDLDHEQFREAEHVHHARSASVSARIRAFAGILPVFELKLDQLQRDSFNNSVGTPIDFNYYFGDNFDLNRVASYSPNNFQIPAFQIDRGLNQISLEQVRPSNRIAYRSLDHAYRNRGLYYDNDLNSWNRSATTGTDLHPSIQSEYERAIELFEHLRNKEGLDSRDLEVGDTDILANRTVTRTIVDATLSHQTPSITGEITAELPGDTDINVLAALGDHLTQEELMLAKTTRAAYEVQFASQKIRYDGLCSVDGIKAVAARLNTRMKLRTVNMVGADRRFGGVGQMMEHMDEARRTGTHSGSFIQRLHSDLRANELVIGDITLEPEVRNRALEASRRLRIEINEAIIARDLEHATFVLATYEDNADPYNPLANMIRPKKFLSRLCGDIKTLMQSLPYRRDSLVLASRIDNYLNSSANPLNNAAITNSWFEGPMETFWAENLDCLRIMGDPIDLEEFVTIDNSGRRSIDGTILGRLATSNRLFIRWSQLAELGVSGGPEFLDARTRIDQDTAVFGSGRTRTRFTDATIPDDMDIKFATRAGDLGEIYKKLGAAFGDLGKTPPGKFRENIQGAVNMAFNLPSRFRTQFVVFIKGVAGYSLGDPEESEGLFGSKDIGVLYKKFIDEGYLDMVYARMFSNVRAEQTQSDGTIRRIAPFHNLDTAVEVRFGGEFLGRDPNNPVRDDGATQPGYHSLSPFNRFNPDIYVGTLEGDERSIAKQEATIRAIRETAQWMLSNLDVEDILLLNGYMRSEFEDDESYNKASEEFYADLLDFAGFDIVTHPKTGDNIMMVDDRGRPFRPILINRGATGIYASTKELALAFGVEIGSRVEFSNYRPNRGTYFRSRPTRTALSPEDAMDLMTCIQENVGIIEGPQTIYEIVQRAAVRRSGMLYRDPNIFYQNTGWSREDVSYPYTPSSKAAFFVNAVRSMNTVIGLADEGPITSIPMCVLCPVIDSFLAGRPSVSAVRTTVVNPTPDIIIAQEDREDREKQEVKPGLSLSRMPRFVTTKATVNPHETRFAGWTLEAAMIDAKALRLAGANDGDYVFASPPELVEGSEDFPFPNDVYIGSSRMQKHGGHLSEKGSYIREAKEAMVTDMITASESRVRVPEFLRRRFSGPLGDAQIHKIVRAVFGVPGPNRAFEFQKASEGFISELTSPARKASNVLTRVLSINQSIIGVAASFATSSLVAVAVNTGGNPINTIIGFFAAYVITGLGISVFPVFGLAKDEQLNVIQWLGGYLTGIRLTMWNKDKPVLSKSGVAVLSTEDMRKRLVESSY